MYTPRTSLAAPRLGGRRLRVALLVDAVDADYQWTVVNTAGRAVREAGGVLLALAGGIASRPGLVPENALYDLVRAQSVDALIVLSSCIGHALGSGGLSDWTSHLTGLPLVSAGMELSGIPSVTVDNEPGAHESTLHLLREHGKTRLAYVGGPAGSPEAEARLAGYRRAFAEQGIDTDHRLIVASDFTWEGGRAAIARLLDDDHVPLASIEGIVCANDPMAFGVSEELGRRGVSIPAQLAVVGFDDTELAQVAAPPLTTVRQPIDALAQAAVRLAFLRQRGEVAESTQLTTRLVVRRSCGCMGATGPTFSMAPAQRHRSEAAVLARRDVIAAEISRAARGTLVGAGTGWEGRLVTALVDELRIPGQGVFLRTLDGLLVRLAQADTDPSPLQDVLGALRAQVLALLEPGDLTRRAEDMLHRARLLISEQLMRSRVRERTELARGVGLLSHLGRRLRGASASEGADAIWRTAQDLGCDAGFVARAVGDGSGELLLAFDRSGPQKGGSFALSELWPGEPAPRSGTLVLHPLLAGGRLVGLCGFSTVQTDGSLHELLQVLVGGYVASHAAT